MAANNSTARTLTIAVLVLGMIATACSSSEAGDGAALPPPPEVRDLRPATPMTPDDGLLRVTVTVPDVGDDSPHTEGGNSDDSTGAAGAGSAEGTTAFGDPERIPSGSTLVVRDNVMGYLGADGTFVPLAAPDDTVASNSNVAPELDKVEYLSSLPGVVTVREITSSTFALSATSTEALEASGIEFAEDISLTFSSDPYQPYQWALDNDGSSLSGVDASQTPSQSPDADVDGLEAREGATGRGVVVAVLDSGVDFSHPDLTHAQWRNPNEDCAGIPNGIDDDGNGFVDDCEGWDFGDEDAITFDGDNDEHGTHVAGIIAAKPGNSVGIAGLAPDAEIMDLKVSDASGMISMSSIARAIRYATDNGADIINLSLGTLPGESLESVAVLRDAVDYADSNQVLLVAAAGNNGVSLDSTPVYPASFDTPNLLVVAATTPADQLASFSNTGSDVDLFAPGDLILSTIPGAEVVFMSGTSQAAPIAAATAALLLERNGSFKPSKVIHTLVSSGDRVDDLNGFGDNPVRLNSARTLGIEVDLLGADDSVTIRGLAADDAGRVTATVSLPELGGQFNQKFHWETSLVALVDGDPFAVVDHPVTVHDVEGDVLISTQTDRRGAVRLADKSSRLAGWSTVLPSGEYALLVEAIPRTDSTVRLGDAFIARFVVGDPAGSATVDDDRSNPTPGGSATDTGPPGGPGESGSGDGGSAPGTDSGGPGEPGTSTDGSSGDSSAGNDAGQSGDDSAGGDDDEANTPTGDTDGPADQSPDDAEGDNSPGDSDQQDDDGTSTAGAESESGTDPESENGPGEEGERDEGAASDDGSSSVEAEDDIVEVGPDQGSEDGWSITSITPRTGPVDTENLVVIKGTFRESVGVWFGEAAGRVTYADENSLQVETPLHSVPETVDVSLRTRQGEVLRLPRAYAFVPIDSDPTVEEGNAGEQTETDGNGDSDSEPRGESTEEPLFDSGPAGTVTIDDPPPPAGDGEDGGRSNRSRNRQARADVIGEPRPLPNGLTGAPISGLDTVGGVPACNEAICRTRRV